MKRTWTDAELEAALIESTERSGVPLKITDPVVLDKIVVLSTPRAERKSA